MGAATKSAHSWVTGSRSGPTTVAEEFCTTGVSHVAPAYGREAGSTRPGFEEHSTRPSGRTMWSTPELKIRNSWKVRLHLSGGRLARSAWPREMPDFTIRARRSVIELCSDSDTADLVLAFPAASWASKRTSFTAPSRARA